MKKHYDFSKARRITPEEVEEYRKAIEALTGKRRRRRPGPKPLTPARPVTVAEMDEGVRAYIRKKVGHLRPKTETPPRTRTRNAKPG